MVPRQLRKKSGIRPGDIFELVDGDEPDVIILKKLTRRPNQGLVDALLACPHWFRMPKRRRASSAGC